jgi:hypothetical protein
MPIFYHLHFPVIIALLSAPPQDVLTLQIHAFTVNFDRGHRSLTWHQE